MQQKEENYIKKRTVAGDNKQHVFISKEDVSSLTMATESKLLTCIINVREESNIAVIDTANTFMQIKADDEKDQVIIQLKGILVDTLVKLAPEVLFTIHEKRQER